MKVHSKFEARFNPRKQIQNATGWYELAGSKVKVSFTRRILNMGLVSANDFGTIQVGVNSWIELVHCVGIMWSGGVLRSA